jgi:hypothetical protein
MRKDKRDINKGNWCAVRITKKAREKLRKIAARERRSMGAQIEWMADGDA